MFSRCRLKDGIFSVLYYIPQYGFGPFRCGKLPDTSFTKEEIPHILSEELGRMTGIKVYPEEARIVWDVRVHQRLEDYSDPREYFLADGRLGWVYEPKTRVPGECWRFHRSQTSHEISAVFQRIQMYKEGYLTVEERLVRWGLAMHISSKIQKFKHEHSKHSEKWDRLLSVLDTREEDIEAMTDFTTKMHLLDPIRDLIPIRVLEVITVFRVLFRLSLKHFELAQDDYVNRTASDNILNI
jgi:hypothetical protein